MKAPRKHVSKEIPHKPNTHSGWVPKVTRSTILICSCKMRYIKTRPGQMTCIKCMVKAQIIG